VINLTDEQAEILAVCAFCQSPLDAAHVKSALEAGEVDPERISCPECGVSEEGHMRGLYKMWTIVAAHRLVERIEKAGLADYYKKRMLDNQLEDTLRSRNRQN
jgi:hypothetical protein